MKKPTLELPPWVADVAAWQDALDAVRAPGPDEQPCLMPRAGSKLVLGDGVVVKKFGCRVDRVIDALEQGRMPGPSLMLPMTVAFVRGNPYEITEPMEQILALCDGTRSMRDVSREVTESRRFPVLGMEELVANAIVAMCGGGLLREAVPVTARA